MQTAWLFLAASLRLNLRFLLTNYSQSGLLELTYRSKLGIFWEMMKPFEKKATMLSVAQEAGVSHATVSYVMAGRAEAKGISAQTANRIRRIARQKGYTPNRLAHALRNGTTHTVGVALPLGTPVQAEILIREITATFRGKGYALTVADSREDRVGLEECLTGLVSRRIDGLVLWTAIPDMLDSQRVRFLLGCIPAVVVVSGAEVDLPGDQIIHDRHSSYGVVAEHFLRGGRRRPAVLARDSVYNHPKLEAFTEALKPSGVVDPRSSVIDVAACEALGSTSRAAWEALCARFPGDFPFDALMCINDEVAIGAMAWLRNRKLRVPEDVAVVGYNDTSTSAFLDPPLASVSWHQETVSKTCCEMLFTRLSDPEITRREKMVRAEFIWRESAGFPDPRSLGRANKKAAVPSV